MFTYKTLLKWKEPQNALKAAKNQITWKDIALSFAVYAIKFVIGSFIIALIFYIFVSYRHGFYVDKNTAFLFLIFLAVGLVFAFVGWIQGYSNGSNSRTIFFGEEYMQINFFLGDVYQTPYQQIQSYGIRRSEFDNVKFRILEIKSWSGEKFEIEIEQSIKSEDIVEIFRNRNIPASAIDKSKSVATHEFISPKV